MGRASEEGKAYARALLGAARGGCERSSSALVEGCSVSTAPRLTGDCREAIHRLLLLLGEGCRRLHNKLVRGVDAGAVELDELERSFTRRSAAAAPPAKLLNVKKKDGQQAQPRRIEQE